MTFIGQSAPDIRKKHQNLDGVVRMNPSQLVDIRFKVYNAQEERKTKQATMFLEAGWGGQRSRTLKRGGEAP